VCLTYLQINSLKLPFFMALHIKNIKVIGKIILSQLKILIKVILKIQVTKSTNLQIERIYKFIEYLFLGKS
jgi:hypothetical protein